MKYRTLPKTGWQISEVSFGCMSLDVTSQQSPGLLQKAFDLGINYFDTADLYDKGENEKLVGEALKSCRKDIFLATKVGNQWRTDGSGWDWNPRKEYIMEAVEGSLRRLQTDYIDLYQLHGGTIDDPIDETIEAFESLKSKGAIREYGISSIRPNVIAQYVQRSQMVSVMMQYSLLDRRPQETCLQLLKENNIGVMVRGAVAKGLLIDKPAVEYLDYQPTEVAQAASAIQNISSDQRSASQIALRYTLKHQAVTTVVAGIRTQKQLLDNASTSDSPSLSAEDLQALEQALPPNLYKLHRYPE